MAPNTCESQQIWGKSKKKSTMTKHWMHQTSSGSAVQSQSMPFSNGFARLPCFTKPSLPGGRWRFVGEPVLQNTLRGRWWSIQKNPKSLLGVLLSRGSEKAVLYKVEAKQMSLTKRLVWRWFSPVWLCFKALVLWGSHWRKSLTVRI